MTQRLRQLEAESLEIFRELAERADQTVILYSVGKDSSVLLHLAQKAFAPAPVPFPLLHVDTGFKFEEMYAFRDQRATELGLRLIVERNEAAIEKKTNPFSIGTSACCGFLKTDALNNALRKHEFRIAIGGARRDEEKSRAKERIFSVRDTGGRWNPKAQRAELWTLYNLRLSEGQTLRVFPLSNWTELDVWSYIEAENIPIVPLYFARPRKMIRRGKALLPWSESLPLKTGEAPELILSRFRTLGCWPCTGAVSPSAQTISEIVAEIEHVQVSERATRAIDHDEAGSMEKKKREGYF